MKQYIAIKLEDFLSRVAIFEQNKYGFSYERRVNENIHILKGKRNRRLLIVSQQVFLPSHIEELKDHISRLLESSEGISDTIDLFSDRDVSLSYREKIREIGNSLQVTFNIFDREELLKDTFFSELFTPINDDEGKEDKTTQALYEYLSMGNDSSFIKNSLNYALILFTIYETPKISIDELTTKICQISGNTASLKNDIAFLKSKGKIKPNSQMENKNTLELTEDENKRISESLKEYDGIKNEFIDQFSNILSRYGIYEYESLLGKLKALYKHYYRWNLDDSKSDGCFDTGNRSNKALQDFRDYIASISQTENTGSLIEEIKDLCSQNTYLNRITLSDSFISLYKSNKYQEYINDRLNYIYFDTPVFIYFILSKSELNDNYGEKFSDIRFQTIKELVDYKEHQNNIQFFVPFDYISEAIGEYQKALRLSVFDKMLEFSIKVKSANTFFNYYKAVKQAKEEYGNKVDNYWFEDFAKEFNFPTIDVNSTKFRQEMTTYLKQYANTLGCQEIPYITTQYDDFDSIKKKYEQTLGQDKSDTAIKCDVRQALYITEESLRTENSNIDYYLATWDMTHIKLRDIVKDCKYITKSYFVKRPNILLNAIGLKKFKIIPENVSNDVFAYADSSFSLSDKIQTLFDNVLAPYFSGCVKQNSSLVNTLVEMQKQLFDSDADATTDIRLPLEEIFLNIEKSLKKNSCTTQDLRKYLCNEENNEFITNLFKSAFDSYQEGHPRDISEEICNGIKNMLAKEDEEVSINETLT